MNMWWLLKKKIGIIWSHLIHLVPFSDVSFCARQYKKKMGKPFAEGLRGSELPAVLTLLKLSNRDPLLTRCSDKASLREYLRELGMERFAVPSLGVFDPKKIRIEDLPDCRCLIKCNNSSGGNYKLSPLDSAKRKKSILGLVRFQSRFSHYRECREWCYKNIVPRLVIEEDLSDNEKPFFDYKFYCFGGKVEYFMVSKGEYEGAHCNRKYSRDLRDIDYLFKETPTLEDVNLPSEINEMIALAETLARPFIHVRVDLYNVNGSIYVSELTFYSGGSYIRIRDLDTSVFLGKTIESSIARAGNELCERYYSLKERLVGKLPKGRG